MRCIHKRFIKERDEMLKKCNVDELRLFIKTHKMHYDDTLVLAAKYMGDKTLEITLHKMIVNTPSLPEELRASSARWLVTRGHGLGIN